MFLILWKPCVLFPFNFLAMFLQLSFLWRCYLWYLLSQLPQLSLLWKCHLWYLYNLYGCMYLGTTCTIVSIVNGSIFPLIIFCAFAYVFSCSFFILEPKAPLSSTLFFLLKALLRESATTFFLFSNVVCIASLVILTLVDGFYGFSF